jgi:ERCC4-type nuclease
MSFRVTVDTNAGETALAEELGRAYAVERRRLDVFDLIFESPDGVQVCVERKTLSDLRSSITDGRARDQKARQHNYVSAREGKATHIVYLIESNHVPSASSMMHGVPALRLYQWMNSRRVEGAHVLVCPERADSSAAVVADFAKKVTDGQTGGFVSRSTGAVVKKAHSAAYGGLVQCLNVVNGMSTDRARAISQKFGTIARLVDSLREEKARCRDVVPPAKRAVAEVAVLADVTVKKRRIGTALAQRVAETLVT